MKHLLFALFFLRSMQLAAQEEEVVFDKVTVHGGFGGPTFELTSVADQTGVMFGGGGGVIVDDFFFGGFGQGSSFAEHAIAGRLYPMDFGFGGLWVGYVKPAHKAVHLFTSVKIAGGGISLIDGSQDNSLYEEAVFVLQPEAGVELNLWKWFRIALTANYRIVSGVEPENLAGLHNSDFSAGGMTLTLRFGKFYRDSPE